MTILSTTQLSDFQKLAVLALWNNEYPQQLQFETDQDLENYLRALSKPNHYLATDEQGELAGWTFVFERETERWFAIIVDRKWQGKGIGTILLQKIKEKESCLNGWVTDHNRYIKADHTPYVSPLDFYLKNEFTTCPESRLETEKLSALKIKWSSNTQ